MWAWLLLLWGIYLTECIVTVAAHDAVLWSRALGAPGRRGPQRFRAARGPQLSRINADRGWFVLPPSPSALAFVAGGDSWDADEIIERVTRVRASTRSLRILATLLGVALLVITPVLIVTSRIEPLLMQWLAVLVVLDVAVIATFVRARRRLRSSSELRNLGLAMLSPIAAIRLPATLAIDVLRDVNPTAAVIALGGDEDALAFARHAWFDAPNDRKRIEKALRKRELFGTLLTPPHADSASAAYCPRCHQQYSKGAQACADCESVALLSF